MITTYEMPPAGNSWLDTPIRASDGRQCEANGRHVVTREGWAIDGEPVLGQRWRAVCVCGKRTVEFMQR